MDFWELGAYDIRRRLLSVMEAMESLFTPMPECLVHAIDGWKLLPEGKERYRALCRYFAEMEEVRLFSRGDMEFLEHIIQYWGAQPLVVHHLAQVFFSDLDSLRNMPLEKQKNVSKIFRPWRPPEKQAR